MEKYWIDFKGVNWTVPDELKWVWEHDRGGAQTVIFFTQHKPDDDTLIDWVASSST